MIFKKKNINRQLQLLEVLNHTQIELESAYSNFENAVDPILIDFYIYQVNAIQMKYKFLLQELKEIPQVSYAKNPRDLSGS